MSYILDALKKSDQERKQGGVPNLQTVHIPVSIESHTPWILYAFITLLLLMLAFVIGYVISNKTPDDIEPSTTSETQTGKVNKHSVAVEQPEIKMVAPRKDEYQNLNTINVGPQSQSVERIERRSIVITERQAPPTVKRPNLSAISYLHEMPDYQQQSVPEMTFAGHVYSTNPASRSIIINNVAMSEGDTVIQGIDVIEITPSGVVFSLHDEFFRMDILQDWSF